MGRRGVRKGIVFVAALEGVVLLLLVGGVSLLPDGVEHAESGADAHSDEYAERKGGGGSFHGVSPLK